MTKQKSVEITNKLDETGLATRLLGEWEQNGNLSKADRGFMYKYLEKNHNKYLPDLTDAKIQQFFEWDWPTEETNQDKLLKTLNIDKLALETNKAVELINKWNSVTPKSLAELDSNFMCEYISEHNINYLLKHLPLNEIKAFIGWLVYFTKVPNDDQYFKLMNIFIHGIDSSN